MRQFVVSVILTTLAGIILACPNWAVAACFIPNQLTNGQTADAAQVMTNFNAVAACANAAPGGELR